MSIHPIHWTQSGALKPEVAPGSGHPPADWLIFAENDEFWRQLEPLLEEKGQPYLSVYPGLAFRSASETTYLLNPAEAEGLPEILRKAFPSGSPRPPRILYLWGLNTAPPGETSGATIKSALTRDLAVWLHLTSALHQCGVRDARVFLLTRGAQPVGRAVGPVSVAQSPLWALGDPSAPSEGGVHCVQIDLDLAGSNWEARLVLPDLMRSELGENPVAFRDGIRYVANPASEMAPPENIPPPTETDANIKLAIAGRGQLDNLRWEPGERVPPERGEIEIRVAATGLNFRDVLNALGSYPGDAGPFGMEAVGKVVTVGEGVDQFAVGDEVVALMPRTGLFRSYGTVAATFVTPTPPRLSPVEAVTLPTVCLTAYYALAHLAGMRAGDRVLIHAAAGGVGLAAVQLARETGAEIFGTAGNPKKRQYLKSIGVHHVMNSRSLDFADEVMQITHGEGVNIVLNSLNGEFIPKSVAILAENGRFLEMGKNGIWSEEQMYDLRSDVAYYPFDLAEIGPRDPELIQALLETISRDIRLGCMQPLPVESFPIQEVVDAFRFMAKGRHIGKVVVVHSQEALAAPPSAFSPIHPDGTYLVAGGRSDQQLQIIDHLVKHGSRYIVLLDWNGCASACRSAVDEFIGQGIHIVIEQGEGVGPRTGPELGESPAKALPVLRGVISLMGGGSHPPEPPGEPGRRQTSPDIPLRLGSLWNLHAMAQRSVEFFLLVSCPTPARGSDRHQNDAICDAYCDALACHRHQIGLPATAIRLAPHGQESVADPAQRAQPSSGRMDRTERTLEQVLTETLETKFSS